MGNSESAPPESNEDFDGVETLGYRVLGVQPNSPASAAGLVSFFDFLLGADEQMLLGSGEELEEGEEYDDIDFPAMLEAFKGKKLQLLVWNIKCQEKRLVDIVPSDDWEGAGLLGVTIRLDNYAGAEDRLIRILSVEHNSPAAIAGLVPSQDYLLGTTTHSFDSTKVLAAVLEAHVDRVVELYVYNTSSDKVRVVALMPTWSWGGNGLLGAEVGTGYLHRLPGECRTTLGGSVERKVRWVGGSKNGPTSPQLQQAATLELEPQLEMEPDDGEDEQSCDTVSLASAAPEVRSRPMTEAAASTTVRSEAEAQSQSQTDNTAPEGETKNHTNATPEAPRNGAHASSVSGKPKEIAASNVAQEAAQVEGKPDNNSSPPPILRNDSGKSYQTHYESKHATGKPVSAPAPYPMSFGADPAAAPANYTTFIPAAKPPEGHNVSAQDLFSSPPPVAKIPSRSNIDFGTPSSRDQPRRSGSNASASSVKSNSEPPFSTPHPPSAVRSPSDTYGGSPPVPPVALAGNGAVGGMPPPPTMSGAHH